MSPHGRVRLSLAVRALFASALLLPFLPACLESVHGLQPLARVIDGWLSYQCERDPARMLGVGAVCARCVGLYVGLGLGALVARPRPATPWLELWLAFGVLAMLADVASEAFGFRPAWAPLRVATSLVLGYAAGVAVVRALQAWATGANGAPPGRA